MVGYGIDRFTSVISVTCAGGIHRDRQRHHEAPRPVPKSEDASSRKGLTGRVDASGDPCRWTRTVTFTYNDMLAFPAPSSSASCSDEENEGGLSINVYLPEHKKFAQQFADTATKQFFFFTSTYSPPFNQEL